MLNQETLYDTNVAISKLESCLRNQTHIDIVYTDWCYIVQKSMFNQCFLLLLFFLKLSPVFSI